MKRLMCFLRGKHFWRKAGWHSWCSRCGASPDWFWLFLEDALRIFLVIVIILSITYILSKGK